MKSRSETSSRSISKSGRLRVVDEDEPRRAHARDLAAELGADGPACPRDEDGVPLEERADLAHVDLDLLAAEHVLDLHRPDLRELHVAGDQLVEAGQRLHRDVRGLRRLDDAGAHLARRRRDRDQHLVGRVVAHDPRQVGGRPEHTHAEDADVLLRRVVVDEADRRVAQHPRALHLRDDGAAGVAGSDDDHLASPRYDSRPRALDHGPRKEPRARDQRHRDQQIHDGNRARQPHVVHRREEVHGDVGDERCDDHSARSAPHVVHRDVAPPAAMEAEEQEDRDLDRDDDQDRASKQRVVVDRQALVEPELERKEPGERDDACVDQELQQAMSPEPAHARDGDADRGANDVDDELLLLHGDRRPERHGEVLERGALGLGQRAWLVAEEAHGRLEMQRRDVVRRRADACLDESRANPVARGRAADEEVVDVAVLVERQIDELAEAELGVPRGSLAATAVPLVEMRQEEAEERRLQLVEPRVVADEVEVDLVARAVEGEDAQSLGELFVVRHDEPAVAEAEEVLRREEAVRREDTVLRDTRRAERLRRVLDQRQAELRQRVERRGPAEEVHRHDRARAARDLRGDVLRIDVERHRVDVGEHRRRASPRDRLGRRVEGERRTDDLVAGADLHRVEHEHERVGAVRDADRPLRAEVGGGLFLERVEVRPPDELAAVEHLAEACLEFGDQRLVLGMDVNERDRHGASL